MITLHGHPAFVNHGVDDATDTDTDTDTGTDLGLRPVDGDAPFGVQLRGFLAKALMDFLCVGMALCRALS